MAESNRYSERYMKNISATLFSLPFLLAACAPAASGTAITATFDVPDAPVKPGDTWEVSQGKLRGDKFRGRVKLDNVSPTRLNSDTHSFYDISEFMDPTAIGFGTYHYHGRDGSISWNQLGFILVYTTDTDGKRTDICVTRSAPPGTKGPYNAYALVGTSAELRDMVRKLDSSDNGYGVLGKPDDCIITKI